MLSLASTPWRLQARLQIVVNGTVFLNSQPELRAFIPVFDVPKFLWTKGIPGCTEYVFWYVSKKYSRQCPLCRRTRRSAAQTAIFFSIFTQYPFNETQRHSVHFNIGLTKGSTVTLVKHHCYRIEIAQIASKRHQWKILQVILSDSTLLWERDITVRDSWNKNYVPRNYPQSVH